MNDIQVPFSGDKDKRPVAIQVGFNPAMGKWEMWVGAGNFEDEAAAKRFADATAEFLRNEASAEMLKAQ